MKSTRCILKLNKSDNHLYLQLPKAVKKAEFQDGEDLHLLIRNHGREFEVIGSMNDNILHIKGTITKAK